VHLHSLAVWMQLEELEFEWHRQNPGFLVAEGQVEETAPGHRLLGKGEKEMGYG
jgi:hypothetical protein